MYIHIHIYIYIVDIIYIHYINTPKIPWGEIQLNPPHSPPIPPFWRACVRSARRSSSAWRLPRRRPPADASMARSDSCSSDYGNLDKAGWLGWFSEKC